MKIKQGDWIFDLLLIRFGCVTRTTKDSVFYEALEGNFITFAFKGEIRKVTDDEQKTIDNYRGRPDDPEQPELF